jgi:hypothetical protein
MVVGWGLKDDQSSVGKWEEVARLRVFYKDKGCDFSVIS